MTTGSAAGLEADAAPGARGESRWRVHSLRISTKSFSTPSLSSLFPLSLVMMAAKCSATRTSSTPAWRNASLIWRRGRAIPCWGIGGGTRLCDARRDGETLVAAPFDFFGFEDLRGDFARGAFAARFAGRSFFWDGGVGFIFFFGAVEMLLPLMEAEDEAVERVAVRAAEAIVALGTRGAARPFARFVGRWREFRRVVRGDRDATEGGAHAGGSEGICGDVRGGAVRCGERVSHLRRFRFLAYDTQPFRAGLTKCRAYGAGLCDSWEPPVLTGGVGLQPNG